MIGIPVKAVFFDAHGVLYDRSESTEHYAARLLVDRGLTVDLPAPDRQRLSALRVEATIGRIGVGTYWEAFLTSHGVAEPGERARLVEAIIQQAHEVHAMPEAGATLATLKRRGFILGIVTDTMFPLESKMAWLARAGVADLIDVVTCSTIVGKHKPDPAIYLDALAQAGLPPAEAAFVGHEARELDGARRVGMATVAVFCGPDAKADYYVRSLPDLLALPIFTQTSH